MNKIKLVIFDLDGTAADTMGGIVEGLNRAMTECGYPTHTYDRAQQLVKCHSGHYIEAALPESARTDEEIDCVLGIYTRHYEDTYTQTAHFKGIPELLDSLKKRCLVAINSNKQDCLVKELTKQLFAPDTFIAAEGYRPDRPSKPDPTMALYIMELASERLGEKLTPDQCVYIGDSDVDYMTAKNAGMRCVSVSWGYRSHEFLRALGDQPVADTAAELWDELVTMGI